MSDSMEITTTDVESWLEIMPDVADVEASDSESVALDIARRILTASTIEEVLTPQTLAKAEDLLNVPLQLRGVRWNRSSFDGGPGMYAVVDAVNMNTGESLSVGCGGKNVMAQLYRAAQLHAFPFEARIVPSDRPTSSGYTPLWLQRA